MTCELAPVSTSIHTGSPDTVPWRSGSGNARPFKVKRSSVERRSRRRGGVRLATGPGTEAASVAPEAVRPGGGSPAAPPHETTSIIHGSQLAARTTPSLTRARAPSMAGALPALRLAEDLHDVAEQLHGLGSRALEGVSSHDAAERAARRHAAHLFEELVGPLRFAAREDDDALAVEGALDDVPDAIGHRLRRN